MELTIDQALQRGVTAHREGKLQEAEKLYRAILEVQPLHPDGNHNLGLIALAVDRFDESLHLFKNALEANPQIEQFWLSYLEALVKGNQYGTAKEILLGAEKAGFFGEKFEALRQQLQIPPEDSQPPKSELARLLKCYQTGKHDEAEKLAAVMTQRFPRHQFGWKILGALAGRRGRTTEALDANERAVKLVPEDAEAHNNLGVTLRQLGRLEESSHSFRRAIALESKFSEAYDNLGTTLQELGKLEQAEVCVKQAIELKPDHADSHYNLGNTLRELGRLEDAASSYRQAIALEPGYSEAHNNLGATFKELMKLDKSEIHLRQAIAINPDFTEAHNNLGNTLKELDRLEESEASFKQAIAINPDFVEAHNNLGNTLQELDRLEESEASLRRAIELKPDYAEAYNNLCSILSGLGRRDEAMACLEQALLLKPYYPEAHYNLGYSLSKSGRLEDAVVSYKHAIALKNDYVDAHFNLGYTLSKLGRRGDAAASYSQAISLQPDHAEAKHMLSALLGETTRSAPRIYVEKLFDHYADEFDHMLINELEYRTPQLIAQLITTNLNEHSLGRVLDLGCGTGLNGVEIRRFCEYLEGIDLSKRMLEKAKERNVYDKLSRLDISNYLATEELKFDCIVCTDVFIYVGDLSEVFQLIKLRNKLSGKFAFSTEHNENQDFFLEQSGRFSHSKQYIEDLCTTFKFKLSHFEKYVLRKENNQDITGGLYLLEF